jgi:hypothetical protein
VNFSEYLISKKIDENAFAAAEPENFQLWKAEFEQMHPNSFTVQKLNLINPLRRKYLLKESSADAEHQTDSSSSTSLPKQPKPKLT